VIAQINANVSLQWCKVYKESSNKCIMRQTTERISLKDKGEKTVKAKTMAVKQKRGSELIENLLCAEL